MDEAKENSEAVSDDVAIAAEAEVTARLDLVSESEPSALDPDLRVVLRRTFERNSW
ncbi:MAG TPA: hypothetical protein VF647_11700 [Longimicrobium sp.]